MPAANETLLRAAKQTSSASEFSESLTATFFLLWTCGTVKSQDFYHERDHFFPLFFFDRIANTESTHLRFWMNTDAGPARGELSSSCRTMNLAAWLGTSGGHSRSSHESSSNASLETLTKAFVFLPGQLGWHSRRGLPSLQARRRGQPCNLSATY